MPLENGGGDDGNSTLGQHVAHFPARQRVATIPAHRHQDDLTRKPEPFERILVLRHRFLHRYKQVKLETLPSCCKRPNPLLDRVDAGCACAPVDRHGSAMPQPLGIASPDARASARGPCRCASRQRANSTLYRFRKIANPPSKECYQEQGICFYLFPVLLKEWGERLCRR